MLIRIQPTILLQIFPELMLYSLVIEKNIKTPDDNFHIPLQAWMG